MREETSKSIDKLNRTIINQGILLNGRMVYIVIAAAIVMVAVGYPLYNYRYDLQSSCADTN